MSCHSFIEPIFSKNAEGGGESAFEIFPLLIFVVELGRIREFDYLLLGLQLTQTGLKRSNCRGIR